MNDRVHGRLRCEFAPGDVLFEEGAPGDEMFVIQEGSIRVSKRVGAAQRTLAVLGPGEFVGEMSILNNKPRAATATAVEATRCIVVSAENLEVMIANNGEIAVRLIRKLSARIDAMNALVDVLMQQDPRARLILGLCRFAELRGEKEEGGLRLAMNAEELARDLGLDPRFTEKLVAKLRHMNLVDEDPDGTILVLDPARLHLVLERLESPAAGS